MARRARRHLATFLGRELVLSVGWICLKISGSSEGLTTWASITISGRIRPNQARIYSPTRSDGCFWDVRATMRAYGKLNRNGHLGGAEISAPGTHGGTQGETHNKSDEFVSPTSADLSYALPNELELPCGRFRRR